MMSQSARRSARCTVTVVLACLSAVSAPAVAQQPLLHLPLDGSLDNLGSIGGTATIFTADGESAPSFVSGYLGQALNFSSRSAVAMPFELDHADYPQVTITAWVREEANARDTRTILTTGSSAGASLSINGGRLSLRAGRTRVAFDEALPVGEWVFVAGVLDTAASSARLHQNADTYVRKDIDTRTTAPRLFRPPDDPDAEPRAYLMVGAFTLQNWQQTARRLSIDDVRVYGDALSEEQVEAIRLAASRPLVTDLPSTGIPTEFPVPAIDRQLPACAVQSDCGTGSYCAFDNTCHPERHLPKMLMDLGIVSSTPTLLELPGGDSASDGTTLEEMRRRFSARNADTFEAERESRPDLQAAAADSGTSNASSAPTAAQSASAENTGANADSNRTGFPVPGNEAWYSMVSGYTGSSQEIVELDGFMNGISWDENRDRPCIFTIYTQPRDVDASDIDLSNVIAESPYRKSWRGCAGSLSPNDGLFVEFFNTDVAIASLNVCSTFNNNIRLKGIQVYGETINPDGTTTYYPAGQTRERPNCSDWQSIVYCPSGFLSTGLVIHYNANNNSPDEAVGLQLVCREVTLP